MALPKSSRAVGDDKAESGSGSKEKGSGGNPASAKMRRNASQTSASNLREAATSTTSAPPRTITETPAPTIDWSSFDREALHSYRRQYHLGTSTSFVSKFHQWVLSRPGSIGQYSPTMVRKQQAQRQSKLGLATAVRKHFNNLGIQENDVIVDFIFKVRSEKNARACGLNRPSGIFTDQ